MKNATKGIKGFYELPLMMRVAARIDLPNGQSGCWQWREPTANGYGVIHFQGRRWLAHRAVYEYSNGPVPQGLELDHVCKNKACCNPAHLEPVTHAENNRRGWADKRKTHCKRGHEFTKENTILTGPGYKHCRTCQTMTNTAWNRKYRSKAAQ